MADGDSQLLQPQSPPVQVPPVTGSRHLHLVPNLDDFNENIDDVDKGVHNYLWKRHPVMYFSAVGGTVLFTLGTLILEIAYANQILAFSNGDPRVFVFPFIFISIPGAIYAHYKVKMESMFMQQVASALNFTYEPKGDAKTLQGVVFENSFSAIASVFDVISGTYDGRPMRIFVYMTPGGRYSAAKYETILEMESPVALPDLILRPISASKSTVSTAEGFSIVPAGYRLLPVEGNFDKYFSIYIPEGSQIEALEVFQPDFMAELIDNYSSYGLEFVGNKFYVYPMKLVTTKQDLLAVLNLTERIYSDVLPTLQGMASNSANTLSNRSTQTAVSGSNLKATMRLNSALLIRVGVLFIILFGLLMFYWIEFPNSAAETSLAPTSNFVDA